VEEVIDCPACHQILAQKDPSEKYLLAKGVEIRSHNGEFVLFCCKCGNSFSPIDKNNFLGPGKQ
jgi:hypothetical protein